MEELWLLKALIVALESLSYDRCFDHWAFELRPWVVELWQLRTWIVELLPFKLESLSFGDLKLESLSFCNLIRINLNSAKAKMIFMLIQIMKRLSRQTFIFALCFALNSAVYFEILSLKLLAYKAKEMNLKFIMKI